MNRRDIISRLLAVTSGVVDGSVDRAALLLELRALYAALGGAVSDLSNGLPSGTQLGLDGLPVAAKARHRQATAASALRERAQRVVRYWILRTGRNPKRTQVSPDRVRAVAKMLRTITDEEAMQAVANVADDDWRQGDNDRNKRFDGIEHIFGKGVERFEELRDMDDAPIDHVEQETAAPRKGADELQAELHAAHERVKRARKGGDRDAFNRWSREERRLRRAVEASSG